MNNDNGKTINSKLTKLINALDAAKIKFGKVARPEQNRAGHGRVNLLLEGVRHTCIVVSPYGYTLIDSRLPFTTRGTTKSWQVAYDSNLERFIALTLNAKANGVIKLKMRRSPRVAC